MRGVWAAALLLVLFLTAPGWSSDAELGTWESGAEGTITVGATPTGIGTACDVAGQRVWAVLQAKAQGIYYSTHSATATPDADDFELTAGQYVNYLQEPSKFRAIRSGASDAKVKYQCYKRR